MKDALLVDSENMDALQALSNLRMVRSNDSEAKIHLTKVYQQIIKIIDVISKQGEATTTIQ